LRYILSFIFALPLLMNSCSNANMVTDKDTSPTATLVKNEDILAKTLLYTEWATVPSIMSMPYADLRNSLISVLAGKCNNPLSSLQSMRDYDLAWGSLMYKFLIDSGTKTDPELKTMSLDDYRNTIIDLNTRNTSIRYLNYKGLPTTKI